MSWRNEKVDYLQKSRDFSFLQDDDRGGGSRSVQRKKTESDDRVPDNQEARDRLLRLKALEKQRADKQKKQYVGSPSPERDDHRYEQRRERDREPAGPSGSKRPPVKDNFGSFFGKQEKVVAKRVVDEKRAREIAAREARIAEAEKAAKARAESRNGSSSMRPPSRPTPKPKPVNPVAVKAQKLKDNRDYSFLFSDGPPSKPDSRAEPSKTSKDVRGSNSEGSAKPKPSFLGASQASQKAKLASSNGGSRPQGVSSARKPESRPASRPGERDGGARYESERRDPPRHANGGGRVAERDTRYETERRPVPSSRGPSSAGKDERRSSGGLDKRPLPKLERAKSVGTAKPTNHDRAREPLPKMSQSSGQKISRERMVQQKTTTTVERKVVSSSQTARGLDPKRKMVGDPVKKVSINAKLNDGRRVERSRYEASDSDQENERRSTVAGGPRPRAAGAPANGLKRKPVINPPTRRLEDPMRRKSDQQQPLPRKSSDEAMRRRVSDEVMRRRVSDEPIRSRPAPPQPKPKKRARDLEDSEYESDSDGGGRAPRASGVSSIIQKLFRYNPNKYKDLDDGDDKNMETSFRHIQAEEKRSARLAREEDEREQELIEEEERQERLRKLKRQKSR